MNYCPISLLFNGPIYWEEVTIKDTKLMEKKMSFLIPLICI